MGAGLGSKRVNFWCSMEEPRFEVSTPMEETSIFFCTKTSRPHSDFEFRMWMRSGRRIEFASGFGAGRKD